MDTNEQSSSKLCESTSLNLELFSCLWLDQNINSTVDNRLTQEELRQMINHLLTFTDENQCQQYIQKANREKIILIVSGKLGQEIIPRIHALPQLSAFYIFCGNEKLHKTWTHKYSKVKDVCVQRDQLINKIKQDQIERIKIEEGALISVWNQNPQSLQERNIVFMWFQLYIEVLLRMHHKLSHRKQLIDLCQTNYKDNPQELKIIAEFDKQYKPENAIRWYTRESGFYRIMNKALRFQHFDTLFAFRFLITDIAKEIKMEHERFLRETTSRELISVYRGQAIGIDELELMKKSQNEFVSMNSFFSTSCDRSTALCFIRSITITEKMKRILFEIRIDPQLQTKSFANIKEMSLVKNEEKFE